MHIINRRCYSNLFQFIKTIFTYEEFVNAISKPIVYPYPEIRFRNIKIVEPAEILFNLNTFYSASTTFILAPNIPIRLKSKSPIIIRKFLLKPYSQTARFLNDNDLHLRLRTESHCGNSFTPPTIRYLDLLQGGDEPTDFNPG